MAKKSLHYFAGGNTAQGFHNLFESNLNGLDRIFILKGGPGTGKSTLMKAIAEKWGSMGYSQERIHCSSDPESLDGVIIPELKAGIFDGTAPHVIEPKAPGVIEEYVNLGTAWNADELSQKKEKVLDYQEKIAVAFQQAYDAFAQALRAHDELESIYIKNLDVDKANQVTAELIKGIFNEKRYAGQKSKVLHRFLGAATPSGAIDFIPNITEGLAKRYFLKGRAGTGKSTLLKKITQAAEERGYDIEIYHCGFDPNSLDMVIVRELNFCVFDSTAPHEHFPSREGDKIIDLYDEIITPGTDETFASEIKETTEQYQSGMKDGISYLSQEKQLHDELEEIYVASMDFSVIDDIREEIIEKMRRLV